MSYTPTVWETGDVITAEKLNKAEQGIAAASAGPEYFFIKYTDAAIIDTDLTIQQFAAKVEAGDPVVVMDMSSAEYGQIYTVTGITVNKSGDDVSTIVFDYVYYSTVDTREMRQSYTWDAQYENNYLDGSSSTLGYATE